MSGSTAETDGLSVTEVRDYVAGFDRETVARMGEAAGAASVHDPGVFGANTHPYAADEIVAAFTTAMALIGSRLRDRSQAVANRLHAAASRLGTETNQAVATVDLWKAAQLDLLEHRFMRAMLRLGEPRKSRWIWAGVLYVVLFVGDLALLAAAMQMLGLSDRPNLWGLTFTDDLHFGALAPATALALAGHTAGSKLKTWWEDVERRRRAVTPEMAERLPMPSRADIAIGVAWLLIGVLIVTGIVWLRIEYMATPLDPSEAPVHVSPAPFAMLQLAMLAGAAWIGFHFTDPTAEVYGAAVTQGRQRSNDLTVALVTVDATAATINVGIEELGTELAKAGHHVHADAGNADGLAGATYPKNVLLSVPEPVQEAMFPDGLPSVSVPEPAELLAALTGLATLPSFTPAALDELVRHHRAAIVEVETRASELRVLSRSWTNGIAGPDQIVPQTAVHTPRTLLPVAEGDKSDETEDVA